MRGFIQVLPLQREVGMMKKHPSKAVTKEAAANLPKGSQPKPEKTFEASIVSSAGKKAAPKKKPRT